jgi:Lipocalin-like domain
LIGHRRENPKMKTLRYAVLAAVVAIAGLAQGQSATRLAAHHLSDKERLIGAWHLVQIDAPGLDGKTTAVPQPKGMLIYTRDGHMSVQLQYPRSASAPNNDYVHDGYEASFGSYDLNEATHTLTHHVQGSITRNLLVGRDLPRIYAFTKDGRLIIRPARPDEHWSVTWEHY